MTVPWQGKQSDMDVRGHPFIIENVLGGYGVAHIIFSYKRVGRES